MTSTITDDLSLQIFIDKEMTLEDLLRERGQLIKKGTLSSNEDLEFWEDGTQTERSNPEKDDEKTV